MEKMKAGSVRIIYIVLAVVYIIAGIWAILNPLHADQVITLFVGGLMLLYGAMSAGSYFMSSQRKRNVWTLVQAVASIILSLIILANQLFGFFTVTTFVAFLTGAALAAVGAVKASDAFSYRNLGMNTWWSVLVLGVVDILVGIIIFLNPYSIGLYLGMGLAASGISDLIIAFADM